jgi:hypothetical protein
MYLFTMHHTSKDYNLLRTDAKNSCNHFPSLFPIPFFLWILQSWFPLPSLPSTSPSNPQLKHRILFHFILAFSSHLSTSTSHYLQCHKEYFLSQWINLATMGPVFIIFILVEKFFFLKQELQIITLILFLWLKLYV